MQCGVEQSVEGIERLVGKIHLRDQALGLTVDLEVNMWRAQPVWTRGIGARLHSLDPIDAVAVGSNADATDEV